MAAPKRKGNVLAGLTRDLRTKATHTGVRPDGELFNIIDYCEAPWGIQLNLFPAQKVIAKLYYGVPLSEDKKENTIVVRDLFSGLIKYELSEVEYLQYLYSEGRCNIEKYDHARRELVLSIGRRAGKCCHGDSLVLTDKGVFRIEDLGQAPVDEFTPASIGIVQEAGKRATSAAFYNGGVKPTFSVRTVDGFSETGTGNHRLKVLAESGKIEWRHMDQIQPGDFLALNRGTDLWASDYLDVTPYHNTLGRKDMSLPTVLDEDLGNLLGNLVGDGSWTDKTTVAMTIEHPETWRHVTRLMTKVFGEVPKEMWPTASPNTGRLYVCGVQPRKFLHDLGWNTDCTRYDKKIPWAILRSPKSVVCAFLRGLFETDGCPESGGRHITLSSASFRLAHEVQVLLLNLGIVSHISRKWVKATKRHYANISIKGVDSRKKFVELIGFDSQKKMLPAVAAASVAVEGKSDSESVPHQYTHLRQLMGIVPAHKGSRTKGGARMTIRELLGNSIKASSGEDVTYPRIRKSLAFAKTHADSHEVFDHFDHLLSCNYFFSKVESVEQGENQVYDLSVPDGESYVANGFTNHNSTISAAFLSYEIYRLINLHNPQAYFGLPNGNRIQLLTVATNKDQAGLLFNEVTTHLAKCEYFKPYICNNTASHINFQTPYDIQKYGAATRQEVSGKFKSTQGKATLRVTFKPPTPKSLRGFGNIVIIMDECAHFQSSGGASSAEEAYAALAPSAMAFSPKSLNLATGKVERTGPVESRIILISSPLAREGLFYDKFDFAMRRAEGSENVLAVQAPTWEINPEVDMPWLRQKFHENPTTFMVEFGAKFSDQIAGWIESPGDLVKCLSPGRRARMSARPREPHQMGIDVGLMGDSTAISITHPDANGKIVLDYHEIWTAGVAWEESNPHLIDPLTGKPAYTTDYCKGLANTQQLDFEEVTNLVEVLSKRFYITAGLFDRWNGLPLQQALHKRGYTQFISKFFSRDDKSKMYQAFKNFMYAGNLDLYDYPVVDRGVEGAKFSPYIKELLDLQGTRVSSNVVIVAAPKNKHDDFADSLVRACFLSMDVQAAPKFSKSGSVDRTAGAMPINPRLEAHKRRMAGGARTVPSRSRALIRR